MNVLQRNYTAVTIYKWFKVFWTVKQMALTETIMSVMKIKHSFLVKTPATTNLLRLTLTLLNSSSYKNVVVIGKYTH